ncbi:M20 family metallopeptidase [Celeribacter sp.]|uniref:M20 family metallopeptidase n=1 Tax=Celeribacter sp. TaxID=1890673 RepID=UPI003A8DBAE3
MKYGIAKSTDGQQRLQLVPARTDFLHGDSALKASIIELTQNLVAVPSQGGVDRQQPIIEALSEWFQSAGLPFDVIRSPRRKVENSFLGLTSRVGSGRGPFYLVTACLDTAPYGDRRNWSYDPSSGRLDHNGWLHGRGSADSKIGIAIFSHLLADLRGENLRGTLVFLADSDEHTGGFGAIKSVVDRKEAKKFQGAYIGYPGHDSIKSGARGFYRSRVTFFGTAQHTGSRRKTNDDAILKALEFCQWINSKKKKIETLSGEFPVAPKVTITSVNGGANSFSITSDVCYVRVDIRLTPSFQKADARRFISEAVKHVSEHHEGQKTKITNEQSWPAYQISHESPLVSNLFDAAKREFSTEPSIEVCGPSNVGNYLASVGVDAVCGFGVAYRGIHQANECIDTDTIIPVYNSYKNTLLKLLR